MQIFHTSTLQIVQLPRFPRNARQGACIQPVGHKVLVVARASFVQRAFAPYPSHHAWGQRSASEGSCVWMAPSDASVNTEFSYCHVLEHWPLHKRAAQSWGANVACSHVCAPALLAVEAELHEG